MMNRMVSFCALAMVVGISTPALGQDQRQAVTKPDLHEPVEVVSLHSVVYSASAERVREVIEQGADVNERLRTRRGDAGVTPLMVASEHNADPEVVRVLLEHGAEPNARDSNGRSALMLAMQRERDGGVAQMLVEHGARVGSRDAEGRTALMYACEHAEDSGVISYLLEQGAEIDDRDAEGLSAIMYATRRDRASGVFELLVKHGASLEERDEMGRGLLMHAAMHARSGDVIDALIELGADIHETRSQEQLYNDTRTHNGDTVLSFACVMNPSVDVFKALLRHGANLNTQVLRYEPRRVGSAQQLQKIETTHLFLIVSHSSSPELLMAALDAGASVELPEGNNGGISVLTAARQNHKLANSDAFWRLNDLSYD